MNATILDGQCTALDAHALNDAWEAMLAAAPNLEVDIEKKRNSFF